MRDKASRHLSPRNGRNGAAGIFAHLLLKTIEKTK